MNYGLGAQFLEEGRLSFRGQQDTDIAWHCAEWATKWLELCDPQALVIPPEELQRSWEKLKADIAKVERERGKE